METYNLMKRALALFLVIFIIVGYLIVPLLPGNDSGTEGSMFPYLSSDDASKNFKDYSRLWDMLGNDSQVDYERYTLVGSPTILKNIERPEKTLYVVLGVNRDYLPADVAVLKEFYEKGGKLIIADDYGYGNTFAEEFDVHFYRHTLWDAWYARNISFPLVFARLDYMEYLLLLDQPTGLYLRPGDSNIQVLANGSKDSYVDFNDNHMIDDIDVPGPIPVIAKYQEPDADGVIIFVSDPGMFNDDKIFNDGLTDRHGKVGLPAENGEFIRDLFRKLLPTGGQLIFDESRHVASKSIRPFYQTLETVTILTSNPRELALMMSGLILIIIMVIAKARDKESWTHEFDIRRITRRADLPESKREVKERLRIVALRKMSMKNGLSREEIQAMTNTQLASLIKDHDLNELILNSEREFSNEELLLLLRKIRSTP